MAVVTLEFPEDTVGWLFDPHNERSRSISEREEAKGTVTMEPPVGFAASGGFLEHPAPLSRIPADGLYAVENGTIGFLQRMPLTSSFIERILHLTELRSLDLIVRAGPGVYEIGRAMGLNAADLEAVGGFRRLEHLRLDLPKDAGDAEVEPVTSLSWLRTLDLAYGEYTGLDLASPHIERLVLFGSRLLNDVGFLSKLHDLRVLSLVDADLDPDDVSLVAQRPNLETLEIGRWASSTVIDALGGHQRLSSLEIRYGGQPPPPPPVRWVNGRMKISRAPTQSVPPLEIRLDRLARLPALETLTLSSCKSHWEVGDGPVPQSLRSLKISGADVDAEKLTVASHIPNLEELTLFWADLTHDDVVPLDRFPSLRTVHIEEYEFPRGFERRLMKGLPHIDFRFTQL